MEEIKFRVKEKQLDGTTSVYEVTIDNENKFSAEEIKDEDDNQNG